MNKTKANSRVNDCSLFVFLAKILAKIRFILRGLFFEKKIGHSKNTPNFVNKLAIKYFNFVRKSPIMTIQRTDTEILITLPASINIDGLQRLLDYLLYKEATKDSQAKQEDVDVLAREVNKEWWANNNHRFIAS
jgi:hypothetical protein